MNLVEGIRVVRRIMNRGVWKKPLKLLVNIEDMIIIR